MRAECCVCGTPITETFWVCEGCERAYGLKGPFRSWPRWVRFLKREEQARRRQRGVEVLSLSDLEDDEARRVDELFYG